MIVPGDWERDVAGLGDGARRSAVEWPTAALVLSIYGGWAALTVFHAMLPVWLLIGLGAWLVAWHSSLQHETVHGHPTRWWGVNRLVGAIPLSLWLPYERYRVTHLAHHRDERLTDPLDDPESYYLTPAQWQRSSAMTKLIVQAQTTLLGRLVLGPPWIVGRFLIAELRAIVAGDRQCARIWVAHLVATLAVVLWLTVV